MSRLLEQGEGFRKILEAKNPYTNKADYNTGHPNALSDGDEKGKGAQGESVGGATDISVRGQSQARNLHTKNNPYNINNA